MKRLLIFPLLSLASACYAAQSINITGTLHFSKKTISGKVTQAQLQKMSHYKIDGAGQFPQGLSFNKGKHAVSNCASYWQYGLDPQNTYQIAMTGFFITTCDALKYLMQAQPAQHNEVAGTHLNNPQLLGLSLLPIISEDDQQQIKAYQQQGKTMASLIQQKQVKVIPTKKINEITLQYEGMQANYLEIARGDFNHDGYQDILARQVTSAIGGSYRGYAAVLLSRTNKNKALQIMPAPD